MLRACTPERVGAVRNRARAGWILRNECRGVKLHIELLRRRLFGFGGQCLRSRLNIVQRLRVRFCRMRAVMSRAVMWPTFAGAQVSYRICVLRWIVTSVPVYCGRLLLRWLCYLCDEQCM